MILYDPGNFQLTSFDLEGTLSLLTPESNVYKGWSMIMLRVYTASVIGSALAYIHLHVFMYMQYWLNIIAACFLALKFTIQTSLLKSLTTIYLPIVIQPQRNQTI